MSSSISNPYSLKTVAALDFLFDTRGHYRFSCEHLAYLSPTLDSFNLQMGVEVSFLSCICVVITFIWIGVCPTSTRVFTLFNETLHSGTYGGIRRSSQTVVGSCLRGLLTSIWSA